MDAVQLFDALRKDNALKKYLAILEGQPLYPVFYDARGQVLSLPPIINSEDTKISFETRNVLIELTGTDLHKLEVCLAVLAGQFSSHCEGDSQFTIEQVEIVQPDGSVQAYPNLTPNQFEVELKTINTTLGIGLDLGQVKECAEKMGLVIKGTKNDNKTILVEVPSTRTDVMHACDIVEDIGIAFGYNNIPRALPPTNTVGKQIPVHKFTDLLRAELAQAGYIESLTMSLLSIKENYELLRRPFNAEEAV